MALSPTALCGEAYKETTCSREKALTAASFTPGSRDGEADIEHDLDLDLDLDLDRVGMVRLAVGLRSVPLQVCGIVRGP